MQNHCHVAIVGACFEEMTKCNGAGCSDVDSPKTVGKLVPLNTNMLSV